jgi:hypothetical protein
MSCLSVIRVLVAQYFQLVDPRRLSLPPKDTLIRADVQETIYQQMFNEAAIWPIPPVSYRVRVLKMLLSAIEDSISNPDEDV